MNIRFGEISEIENFPLFSEENEGSDVVVAESDGEIIGYMQINEGADDATVFFMESTVKGAGSALLNWLKARCSYIVANNVVATAEGFYARMGFERAGGNGYANQFNMAWEA